MARIRTGLGDTKARSLWQMHSGKHSEFGTMLPRLAFNPAVAYAGWVVTQPFINVEEEIGKVVGRRTRTPDAFESGMKLQALAAQLHTSFKHRWAPKGVYRFKTHEEADEWMNRMLARSQIPRS